MTEGKRQVCLRSLHHEKRERDADDPRNSKASVNQERAGAKGSFAQWPSSGLLGIFLFGLAVPSADGNRRTSGVTM